LKRTTGKVRGRGECEVITSALAEVSEIVLVVVVVVVVVVAAAAVLRIRDHFGFCRCVFFGYEDIDTKRMQILRSSSSRRMCTLGAVWIRRTYPHYPLLEVVEWESHFFLDFIGLMFLSRRAEWC